MKKKLYGAWATIRPFGGSTSYEKIFHFFADPDLEWVGGIDAVAVERAKTRFRAREVVINSSWRSHGSR